MEGDLKDFNLGDLVQICCQHPDDVRLTVTRGETVATVYFSGMAIVHAESPRGLGKAALFDALGWATGVFQLDKDVKAPLRTIDQGWVDLLAEAKEFLELSRRQLEASDREASPGSPRRATDTLSPGHEALAPPEALVRRLKGVKGVRDALLAGPNGEVLTHAGESDPERLAAICAFVGGATLGIGRDLGFGELKRAVIQLGRNHVLVTRFGSDFAGIRFEDDASVDQVSSEARSLLGGA